MSIDAFILGAATYLALVVGTTWIGAGNAAVCLLVLAPVLKDGPLDLDLWTLKVLSAAAVCTVAAAGRSPALASPRYPAIAFWVVLGFGAAIVSHVDGGSSVLGNEMLKAFAAGTFAWFAFVHVLDARRIRYAMAAIGSITVFAVIVALVQSVTVNFRLAPLAWTLQPELRHFLFVSDGTVDVRGIRFTSFLFHSNQLGHLGAVAFGLFFPLLLAAPRSSHAGLQLSVVASSLLVPVLTQSRIAFLTITLQALAAFAMVTPRSQVGRALTGRLATRVLAPIIGAALIAFGNVVPFARRLTQMDLAHRAENWRHALALIPKHLPWGVGPGLSSPVILAGVAPFDDAHLEDAFGAAVPLSLWGSHPHNFLLATLLETGVFGLIAQVGLVGAVLSVAIRRTRAASLLAGRPLAVAATLVLATETLSGTVESYRFLWSMETGLTVAFMMAVLLYLDGLEGRGAFGDR